MADYALVVHGKRIMCEDGRVMTEEGERFLVLSEDSGWVEATSTRYKPGREPPSSVKTWKSKAAAEVFAKRWKGHPWWCTPNGNFELLELVPVMAVVGYKLKDPA